MLWLKAFHIITLVAWFAGLFYLPRLFVYHAQSTDGISIERFKIMEHKLYYYIMFPAGLLATLLGISLLIPNWPYYLQQSWMLAKLILVLALWGYHLSCGWLITLFKHHKNSRKPSFYRWFNEIPTVLLVVIVILVVVKP